MAEQGQKSTGIVRKLARFLKLSGVTAPTSDNANQGKVATTDPVRLSNYSIYEIENIQKRSQQVGLNNQGNNSTNIAAYLTDISRNSQHTSIELRNLKILTPEIDQAKSIIVSSIMSPTDMQTDAIGIDLNVPDLNEEGNAELIEYLSDFFNNQQEIGIKLTKWLGNAIFDNGSSPVIVMPKSNIRALGEVNRISMTPPISFDISKAIPSTEGLTLDSKEVLDVTVSLESILPQSITNVKDGISNTMPVTKDSVANISKSLIAGVNKLLNDHKNSIIISGDAYRLAEKYNKIDKSMQKMTKKYQDAFIPLDSQNKMMVVDESTELEHGDHPLIIDLPSHAVIPVTIPGKTSEHFGYFILLDQYGNPADPMEPVTGVPNATSVTPTGALSNRIVQSVSGGTPPVFHQLSDMQRFNAVMSVFGTSLNKVMTKMLEDDGISGVTVQRHDAIYSYILQQLVRFPEVKIQMIFVPASVMVYYAFDYRPDGTGKSILEDLGLVLALRNTLFISSVMAAMKNAVDNKVVEINVDEKNVNLEQTLDLVRNIFTEKHMFKFDNNPLNIARDIIQKSLTIIPKGIKGLQESLSVTNERKPTGSIAPDNEMMEKFTNMLINGMTVPPSALNQLSDTEYAKSVATNNLFFSNNTRIRQRITIQHTTKLLRNILKYSDPLQRRISEIIEKYNVDDIDNAKDKQEAIKKERKSTQAILKYILNNIKVSLPKCTISVDNAHYNELKTYIQIIDDIVDKIYHEDLVADSSEELKATLASIKVYVKRMMIKDFLEHVSFEKGFNIPEFTEIDTMAIKEMAQFLLNHKKGMVEHIKQLNNKLAEGTDTSTKSSW